MNRLKRLLRWTSGGLTALLIAVIAVLVFGDLSAFRERAEKRASQTLGRAVKIAGAMTLRPSLPPVIALDDVSVGNPQWSYHDNLLHVDRLILSLSLTDLLVGDITIHTVELDSFELILERNPDGDVNWRSQPPAGGVPVETLALNDGVVRWVDHRHAPYPEIRIDTFEGVFSATETYLEADLAVLGHAARLLVEAQPMRPLPDGGASWKVEAQLDGDYWSLETAGEIGSDLEGEISLELRADELSVLNDVHGLALPPLGPAGLDAVLSADADTVRATDVRIEIGENVLQGDFALYTGAPTTRLEAEVITEHLQLADMWRASPGSESSSHGRFLDTALPVVELATTGVDADVLISAKGLAYRETEIGAATIHFVSRENTGSVYAHAVILGGQYDAELAVTSGEDAPTISLRAKASGLDLSKLASDVGPMTGDQVSAALELSASGASPRELLGSMDAEVLIEDVTINPPTVPAGGELLHAEELVLRAGDGIFRGFELSGKLGEQPFSASLHGGKPVLELTDSGPWPLAAGRQHRLCRRQNFRRW